MPFIQGPGGQKFRAKDVDFSTRSEHMNLYETENGINVRMKTAVIRILVAVDDSGNPIKLDNGEPLVQVQSQNIVTAEIRDD